MAMVPLVRGTVIGKKWTIADLVGAGACGQVYAVNASSSSASSGKSSSPSSVCGWVAKVIALPKGTGKSSKDQKRLCDTLFYEYTLFHGLLAEFPFRPAIPDILSFHGTDETVGVRYMVMQRFERDLIGLARATPKPTIAQVSTIGLQLVDGLEWLHRKGLLFIDVKPDNFMLNAEQQLFFVDYGLVERWVSTMGSGAKPDIQRQMVGTPTFASLDVHGGHTPMRKDDMEAMAMVLISLFSDGQMPWSTSQSDTECRQRKINCDIEALASSLNCAELGRMVMQIRALKYDEKPDYDAYKALLTTMKDRKTKSSSSSSSSSASSSSSVLGKKKAGGGSSSSSAAASAAKVYDDDEEAEEVIVISSKKTKTVPSRSTKKGVTTSSSVIIPPKTPLLPRDEEEDDDDVVIVSSTDVKKPTRGGKASSSSSSTSRSASVAEKKTATDTTRTHTTSTSPPRKSSSLSYDGSTMEGQAETLSIEITAGPHQGEKHVLGVSTNQAIGDMCQKIVGRSDGVDIVLSHDDFISER